MYQWLFSKFTRMKIHAFFGFQIDQIEIIIQKRYRHLLTKLLKTLTLSNKRTHTSVKYTRVRSSKHTYVCLQIDFFSIIKLHPSTCPYTHTHK